MLIYMDEVFTEGEKKHHLLKNNAFKNGKNRITFNIQYLASIKNHLT